MRLQLFGHRESRYERPTLNWCCGGEEQCPQGPDASGGCRAGAMCQPVKVGNVYKCARSPVTGGPCAEGPGPSGQCGCIVPTCMPRPTVRARRARIARWATLVAVAAVLIALSVTARETWLAGPLSAGHSEIGDCTACHAAANDSASVWLHQAFLPTDPVRASESCLGCHDRGGPALALAAHNQPAEVLQSWRADGASQSAASDAPTGFALAAAVFGDPTAGDGGPACATCHQEHRGGIDFAAMSDQACQSCHSVKFDGFPDGHPDFGAYPYRERQHIAFNHASHIDRHFPKADAAAQPENCTSCHVADSAGTGMLLTGFEGTCAVCHDADIRKGPAAGPPGGPFLAVPGLDLETLAEKEIAVGFWPDSFYDRGIPPVMRALLSVGYIDPAQLDRLEGVDLLDLTQAGPEVLEAVAAFAWATKAMMADMLQQGVLGDADAMREVFGVKLTAAAISRLGGSVPRDVLAQAADAWFGCSLYTEVAAFRDGTPPATLTRADHVDGKPPVCVEAKAVAAAVDAGASAGEGGAAAGDIAPSALDGLAGDSPLGGSALGGGILGGDSGGGNILGDAAPADGGGGGILGASPLGGGILGGGSEGGADSILGGIGSDGETGEAPEPETADDTPGVIEPEPVDPAEWARHGGWYRTAEVVYYRPVEHADRFLRAWLDFAGSAYGSASGQALGKAIFDAMGQPTSLGRCAKCHGASKQADGSVMTYWQARTVDTATRPLTKFRHAPHLTIGGQEACNRCHTVARGDEMMASFKGFDATDFKPGFVAMTKDTCAACHATAEAGSQCQHCHSYHVGTFSMTHPMGRLTTTQAAEKPE